MTTTKRKKPADNSCAFCRHFSRTSMIEGFCMQHRRTVRADNDEHCFAK